MCGLAALKPWGQRKCRCVGRGTGWAAVSVGQGQAVKTWVLAGRGLVLLSWCHCCWWEQWWDLVASLHCPRCSACHYRGVVVACLLLSRSAAEVEKFPVTLPLCSLTYIRRLEASLRFLFCSWYYHKSYSCFLGVMFCGLWRALAPVLRMPSKQFVCVFKWWHVVSNQGCGERPDKTKWGGGRAGKQHFADLALQI